jgi:hypothetical protein
VATKKTYTVVLYEQAAEELGKLIALWLRRDELGSYIYARKVDPNGPYFHMVLDEKNPDGTTVEFEFQIPHSFVKAVFYTTDIKRLGFN